MNSLDTHYKTCSKAIGQNENQSEVLPVWLKSTVQNSVFKKIVQYFHMTNFMHFSYVSKYWQICQPGTHYLSTLHFVCSIHVHAFFVWNILHVQATKYTYNVPDKKDKNMYSTHTILIHKALHGKHIYFNCLHIQHNLNTNTWFIMQS